MEGANIAHVIVRDNESLESALKRFKKKVENEGVIKEFKERQYFVKPSLLRHEQERAFLHKANRKKSSNEKKMSRSKKRKRPNRDS